VDAVSLIIAALAAGAASALQDGASEAVREADARLRDAVRGRLRGRPNGELVLARHETAPNTWRLPLAGELSAAEAGTDAGLVDAARALLELVDVTGSRAVKYTVTVAGSRGVQVGDHNTQVTTFGDVHITAPVIGMLAHQRPEAAGLPVRLAPWPTVLAGR
jgi:hypothetical protein